MRKLTHCILPGHGTRCELGRERRGDDHHRPTERLIAMRYEQAADGVRWYDAMDIGGEH